VRDENQTHLEFVHYYTHLHLTPLILHAIIGAKRQMRMILNNDLGRLACNKYASTSGNFTLKIFAIRHGNTRVLHHCARPFLYPHM
jgi:hypothetical protein